MLVVKLCIVHSVATMTQKFRIHVRLKKERDRRRRESKRCLRQFTTFEEFEDSPLFKEGRREKFSRSKMMAGMLSACEKKPISKEQIEGGSSSYRKNST